MSQLKDWLKDFKMNEGLLSMVLGGLVIVIVIGLLVGYVRKINTKPGQITDKSAQTEISPTPSQTQVAQNYTVVRGDTLYHIGIKLCNNPYLWPQIASQNNVSNPHLIFPDQTLTVLCYTTK